MQLMSAIRPDLHGQPLRRVGRRRVCFGLTAVIWFVALSPARSKFACRGAACRLRAHTGPIYFVLRALAAGTLLQQGKFLCRCAAEKPVFHTHCSGCEAEERGPKWLSISAGYETSGRSSVFSHSLFTAACNRIVRTASTIRAANIRSVLARPLAKSIRYPKPFEAPTHSPMIAPMGA